MTKQTRIILSIGAAIAALILFLFWDYGQMTNNKTTYQENIFNPPPTPVISETKPPPKLVNYLPAGPSKYAYNRGFGLWEGITAEDGNEAVRLKFDQSRYTNGGLAPDVSWVQFICKNNSLIFDSYNDDVWVDMKSYNRINVDGRIWRVAQTGSHVLDKYDTKQPIDGFFKAMLNGREGILYLEGKALSAGGAVNISRFTFTLMGITKASKNVRMICG